MSPFRDSGGPRPVVPFSCPSGLLPVDPAPPPAGPPLKTLRRGLSPSLVRALRSPPCLLFGGVFTSPLAFLGSPLPVLDSSFLLPSPQSGPSVPLLHTGPR